MSSMVPYTVMVLDKVRATIEGEREAAGEARRDTLDAGLADDTEATSAQRSSPAR